MLQTRTRFFVTGGTLPPDATSYVCREADVVLLESLRAGEFCYVLNTRQMGKSSLMVRTADRLQQEGATVVMLDLTALGHNLSVEQWYAGLLLLLGEQLGLSDALEDYWQDKTWLGPMQRWMAALRAIVLPALSGSLVLFVDEIDAVRGLGFSTDEFFGGIRECYNRRTYDPIYRRLIFCLLGVAAPTDLITASNLSPFNIGTRIPLTDFSVLEAAPLEEGIRHWVLGVGWGGDAGVEKPEQVAEALLARVLYWTGGHPYMTQRLCQSIVEQVFGTALNPQSPSPPPHRPTPDTRIPEPPDVLVDSLCHLLFLSKAARDSDDNLAFVRNRLLRSDADVAALLDLYGQIRMGRLLKDDETNPLHVVLRLAGIVRVQDGVLVVRNRIYRHVFDRQWVRSNMPDAEQRRQRAAYRRGFAYAGVGATLIIAIITLLAVFNYRTTLRAQRAEARAVTEADYANRLLYASNINLAQQRYDATDLNSTLDLLDQTMPAPGKPDLRGFEWYYLHGLCHQARLIPLGYTVGAPFLAVSPDGKTVVAGSQALPNHEREVIEFWDTSTWRRRITVPAASIVTAIRFAPDGKTLAVGDTDGRITLYDPAHGSLLRKWHGHRKSTTSLGFAPDGRSLASGSNDGTVRVWDFSSGHQLQELPAHVLRGVWTVAYAPDGRTLAAGCDDGAVRLWDTASWQLTGTLRGHSWYVYSLAFSPDGTLLATGSGDRNVILWDTRTRHPRHLLRGHSSYVYTVAFAPDGKTLATGGWDNAVRLWDTASGMQQNVLRHVTPVYSIAFLPHTHTLISAIQERWLQLWDTTREAEGHTLAMADPGGYIRSTAISPDGKLVAAGNRRDARIWEIATGRRLCTLHTDGADMSYIAFSPDGNRLAASGGTPDAITIWDVHTAHLLRRIAVEGDIGRCCFTRDGKRILAPISRAETQGAILGIDLSDGHIAPIATTNRGLANGMISHDQTQLAIILPDGRIYLHDVATGRETRLSDIDAAKSCAFSPDDRRIVVGLGTSAALVLDVATGRRQLVLKGHRDLIRECAFSADGRRIVTTSYDRDAKVWDAVTGRELVTLRGYSASMSAVAISQNGDYIATAKDDGTVKVWEAHSGR